MENSQAIPFGGYYWNVLDIQDGRVLILSSFFVRGGAFHNEREFVSWANSDIRRFLNGTFLNSFSEEEQAQISISQIPNPANPWLGTKNAPTTNDKIFLLCVSEVILHFGDSGQLANHPTNAGIRPAMWIYVENPPI